MIQGEERKNKYYYTDKQQAPEGAVREREAYEQNEEVAGETAGKSEQCKAADESENITAEFRLSEATVWSGDKIHKYRLIPIIFTINKGLF